MRNFSYIFSIIGLPALLQLAGLLFSLCTIPPPPPLYYSIMLLLFFSSSSLFHYNMCSIYDVKDCRFVCFKVFFPTIYERECASVCLEFILLVFVLFTHFSLFICMYKYICVCMLSIYRSGRKTASNFCCLCVCEW